MTGAVTNIDMATQKVERETERERGTEKDEKYQKKSSKSIGGTDKAESRGREWGKALE